MKRKTIWLWLVLGALLFGEGCAAGPGKDTYPAENIHRSRERSAQEENERKVYGGKL